MQADEHENFTLLIDATAANTEGLRRLILNKVRRDRVAIRVRLDAETIAAIQMMAVVRVIGDIFDYSSGRDFRILGYTIDTKNKVADLVLWG